jgi:carbon storage regulator
MLVLSRKNLESVVVLGSDDFELAVKVTVLEIKGNRVRLGFVAEDNVPIHRLEVWQKIRSGDRPAAHSEDSMRQLNDGRPIAPSIRAGEANAM